MFSGLKLKGKHILVVSSSSHCQTRAASQLLDSILSQDGHLTLICPKPSLTKEQKRLIAMGVLGYLDRYNELKSISTSDYHLVVLMDKLDYEIMRPKCDFSRTWLSVLNCNELSDVNIEYLDHHSDDDDSTTTKVSEQDINENSRTMDLVEDWNDGNHEVKKPKLYIVGAGIGAPDLITVRAQLLLQTVPVVITDRLVSAELLATIPLTTRILFSRKVCGKANEAQDEINNWILEHLEKGMDVLRLKGGDPFVFGRGGEEWNLVSDKYAIEWVPGISSSIAAAGAAGIPVTHRGVADSFVVCTGTLMNPSNWSRIPEYDSKRTLVLLMATKNFGMVVNKLIGNNSYPRDLPVAIVYRATLKDQKVLYSTLQDSPALLQDSDIRNHSTIVVGNVVHCLEKGFLATL